MLPVSLEVALGSALFAFGGWLITTGLMGRKIGSLKRKNHDLELKLESAWLQAQAQKERYQAQVDFAESYEERLSQKFESMAKDALLKNHQSLTHMAENVLSQVFEKSHSRSEKLLSDHGHHLRHATEPLQESLSQLFESLKALDGARIQSQESLKAQVACLIEAQQKLEEETRSLSSSLQSPQGGGNWGEIQVRRILEASGMMGYCDFSEQGIFQGEEGKRIRPDFIVRLPEGKHIIIDAKTPLASYRAFSTLGDKKQRQKKQEEYIRSVRQHLVDLSKKNYWRFIPGNLEFVIMFLPGESMLGSILELDPGFLEFGLQKKIIPATPTSLMVLLHIVEMGWRHKKLSDHGERIQALGVKLEKRILDFFQTMDNLGKGMDLSVRRYNQAVKEVKDHIHPMVEELSCLGLHHQSKAPMAQDLKSVNSDVRLGF